MKVSAVCLLLISLLVVSAFLAPKACLASNVSEAKLTIYRDGVAHVYVKLSVEEIEPTVSVPLLASDAYNILVLDESGETLAYDVNGSTLTVYTLGATAATVEYDTEALTYKEAGIWTLKLTAPSQLDVTLPEGSTIIHLSSAPAAINVESSKITLTLRPGEWEISYEVTPQPAPQPPHPSSHQSSPQPSPHSAFPVWLTIYATIVIVAAVAFLLIKRKRRLEAVRTEDEARVLEFLRENGGKALEAELREAFPHIPRTSMWRLVRRLERRGVVKIKKVGLQNVVELK